MQAGRILVCNVSRTVVAAARRDFAGTRVIYITALASVRAGRVAARGREPASSERVLREASCDEMAGADLVIDNSGTIEAGVAKLVAFLKLLTKSPDTAKP